MPIKFTPADLPDILSGMSTAAGITDAEIKQLWDSIAVFGWHERREQIIDFARAVEARTRAQAPAADAMAEAIEVLRPFEHAADNLDDNTRDSSEIWESAAAMCICAKDLRRVAAFIARHTGEK